MEELPEIPDLIKYDKLFTIDLSPMVRVKAISHADLQMIAETCNANFLRTFSLTTFAPVLMRSAIISERLTTMTNVEVAGQAIITTPELINRGLLTKWSERHHENFVRESERLASNPNAEAEQLFQGTALLKNLVLSLPPASTLQMAFSAIYDTLVVDAWTSFESVAGDLWVAAVNSHPKRLAGLSGHAKRIQKLAREKRGKEFGTQPPPPNSESDATIEPKSVRSEQTIKLGDIQRLTGQTFDLRKKMGQLLREGELVGFARLDDIRASYALAFGKHSRDIDAALADPSLDRLSTVRNLLVHQRGIADEIYVKKREYIHGLPPLEDKQKLVLDGELVARLVSPAIRITADLLTSVEAWMKME